MHYAVITSVVIASLLGAAAMSVVQAAEAPQVQTAIQIQSNSEGGSTAVSNPGIQAMEISVSPVRQIDRPARESYYGQGFESRGIDKDNLSRGGSVFGSGRGE